MHWVLVKKGKKKQLTRQWWFLTVISMAVLSKEPCWKQL